MSEHSGVVILFFDIPMSTSKEKREYRKFRKMILAEGYVELQQSVYVKMMTNIDALNGERIKIQKLAMDGADIKLLPLTAANFRRMQTVCGTEFDFGFISSELLIF